MLSALVMIPSKPVPGSARPLPEALVRTLASLVPAAVEGVLRDLTIVAADRIDGLETVADHAGCEIVRAPDARQALMKSLAAAREDNIFLLRCGRAPESGFAEEIAELLQDGRRLARMRERPSSFLARLAPSLAPASALLITRERLKEIAGDEFAQISVRMGRAPLMRARARLVD